MRLFRTSFPAWLLAATAFALFCSTTWSQATSREGCRNPRKRLGAEHKGLRVRGLAVGSSPLPWAHFKLAADRESVKGLVGLDGGGVCSRGVKRRFDRPTPRPGTVVPSAEPRRGGGGEGRPAVSIDGRPTARRNARRRAGDTAVAAPSDCVRPKPRPSILQGQTRRAGARSRRARVSAQPTIPDFLAVTVRDVKCVSCPRSEARASGFAAPPAVRRCGE